MRQTLTSLLFFALLVVAGSPAEARRVALVIGISDYDNLSTLGNPVGDAKAIADVLRTNGFDVFEYYDLSRADLLDALEDFKREADQAAVALAYYAGHGMEIAGRNIIAPTDIEISCEPKEARRAVELDKLFEALGSAPQQAVMLDACRNDPFPQCASRAARAGSGFRGLARVADVSQSLLIANATLPGQLAADGPEGEHSPFAEALLARFQSSSRAYFRDLLDQTARDVQLATAGAQIPEVTTRGGAPRFCLTEDGCGGDIGQPAEAIAADEATVDEVGALLAKLGYISRRGTTADALADAVRRFQSRAGLPPSGRIDATLLAVLRATALQVASLPPATGGDVVVSGPSEFQIGESFKDCESCPEMTVVPAGTFQMGAAEGEAGRQTAELPRHPVRIDHPFAVSSHEITFDEWELCALEGGCNGYMPEDGGWGRGTRPAIFISWDDAKAYVDHLRRKTGKAYRLLTEAEWEYAARAGTTTPYATGQTITTAQADFDDSASVNRGEYLGETVDVGSYPPNPFGLFDMHGNVWEWVEDCWNASHAGAPGDGSARGGDCARRVLKGGAWYFEAEYLRAAARVSYPAGSRLNVAGFRVARTLE